MPGVIQRLVTAKTARVLRDNLPILPDDDAFGIGMDVDRAADRL